MRKDLIVAIFSLVLFSTVVDAQELIVQFTAPSSQSELLNLPKTQQSFVTRESLNKKINEELERLQINGYLSATTLEKPYQNDQGLSVLEISFHLGPQWQEILFSYPKSLAPYVKKSTYGKQGSVTYKIQNDSTYATRSSNKDEFLSLNSLRLPIREIPIFLTELSKAIATDYSPFSSLKFVDLEPSKYPTLRAKLIATLQPKLLIDSLAIKDYANVDPGILKHKAGLKLPLPFNEELIRSAEEQLSLLPYIEVLRPSETLFEQEKTTLYMYLEKKQANQIEGILGFGTDPERQSLKLNGYANIQLWNNLNKGERFDLRYKADGNQQERLEIQSEFPHLAQTPFGLKGTFELFRRDSTFTTMTSGAQITYNPFGSLALGLGYTSVNSNTGAGTELIQNNIVDFQQSFWGLEVRLEKRRNSVIMPRRYLIKLGGELGKSELNPGNSGATQPEIQTFTRQRVNFELDYLIDLWQNHYLWLYHKTAFINGDGLVNNELYRFGGTQSLRGFNENLIETSQVHLIQTEYRLSFTDVFYIHHLTDVAFYKNDQDGAILNNYSVGLGIATATRAGILNLQIAQGFGKRTDFSTNNTKIHLVFKGSF